MVAIPLLRLRDKSSWPVLVYSNISHLKARARLLSPLPVSRHSSPSNQLPAIPLGLAEIHLVIPMLWVVSNNCIRCKAIPNSRLSSTISWRVNFSINNFRSHQGSLGVTRMVVGQIAHHN